MNTPAFLDELLEKMKEILALTKKVTTASTKEEAIVGDMKSGFNKLLIAALKAKKDGEVIAKVAVSKESGGNDAIPMIRKMLKDEAGMSDEEMDDEIANNKKKFGLDELHALRAIAKEMALDPDHPRVKK